MRSEDLFTREGFIRYISLILAAGGVIVIRSAFKIYKLSAFLGFSIEKEKFITSGILAHVRHPIYLGTILIAVGFWLFTPDLATLISVVCIFIYLPFGIYLEEKKLTRQFGKEYLDYKKKVPAIVPKLF
jgi:protein-S-isoprenylcysteine O-methyltransferase Ste14